MRRGDAGLAGGDRRGQLKMLTSIVSRAKAKRPLDLATEVAPPGLEERPSLSREASELDTASRQSSAA